MNQSPSIQDPIDPLVARERLRAHVVALSPERVGLAHAVGRVAAQDTTSRVTLPRWDSSAMDGYAVSAPHGASASWTVVRELAAGSHPIEPIAEGEAARIFTGAPVPDGTWAVIAQERIARDGDAITARVLPHEGANIRRGGEDFAGGLVLPRGARIAQPHLALLAALDITHVEASRKPDVAVITTGDEIRAAGEPDRPGRIPDAISPAIVAALIELGAKPRVVHVGHDSLDAFEAATAGLRADLIVTIGGASVGDHDRARQALRRAGFDENVFSRVLLKPGKPAFAVTNGESIAIGLPGNPSAAIVTFALFVAPFVRALAGDDTWHTFGSARMPRAPEPDDTRWLALKARITLEGAHAIARADADQKSGSVVGLARSDGFVLVPPRNASCAPDSTFATFTILGSPPAPVETSESLG